MSLRSTTQKFKETGGLACRRIKIYVGSPARVVRACLQTTTAGDVEVRGDLKSTRLHWSSAMFYEPDKKDHGLKHSPYKSCMVPRPIGWISTQSRSGRINLAPYSQFNNVGYEPGYLMFSGGGQHPDGGRKDTVINAEETGEFVYNMATFDLRDAVSLSAQITDSSVDEMEAVGLTAAPSKLVKPPRVAESPISIECKYYTTLILPGLDWTTTHHVVIGRVVGIHIKEEFIDADGKIDIVKIRPLARLGYTDYTSVESTFTLDLANESREFLTWGMSGGN